MNRLPDSVPIETKVSFFEYQRKEWEKVLESSKNALVENQPDAMQHWSNVNRYALAKIAEIDSQLEELKRTGAGSGLAKSAIPKVTLIRE